MTTLLDRATNKRNASVLILCIAFMTRCSFLFFTSDDAYITFRHVSNFLAGNGLVYNAGERVLGTTSPLFALVLSLLGFLGLDYIFWGKILCVLAGSLSCVLLYRLLYRDNGKEVALLAGILSALQPNLVVWSASGMETGLAVFLALSAISLYVSERYSGAGVILGLAVLSRFDMGLLGIVLCVHFIVTRKAIPWRIILMSSLVVLPWLAISYFYYGSIFPNSLVAKFTVYKGTTEATTLWQKCYVFFGRIDKAVLSLVALWGFVCALRTRHSEIVLYLWAALHLVSLMLSEGLIFAWYYSPVFPAYVSLVAIGIVDIVHRMPSMNSQRVRFAIISLTVALILYSGLLLAANRSSFIKQQERLNNVHKKIGIWLNEHAERDAQVLAGDIGYIGFYSGNHIIDWAGLVSPRIIDYYKSQTPLRVIHDFTPDYIVLGEYDLLYTQLKARDDFDKIYEDPHEFRYGDCVYHLWSLRY